MSKLLSLHPELRVPIQLGPLAGTRGIDTIRTIPLSSDGFLAREGSRLVIYINERLPSARQRFTCAHEIGHTYFSSPRPSGSATISCQTGFANRPKQEEYLCDVFAAELLMPTKAVEDMLHKEGVSIKTAQRMALGFHVSLSAAVWRMCEMAGDEVGFIWFRPMGKPTDPDDVKLRVDWGAFPTRERTYLPRHDSVPRNSLVAKSFSSNQVVRGIEKVDLGALRGKRYLTCQRLNEAVLCLVFLDEPSDHDRRYRPPEPLLET